MKPNRGKLIVIEGPDGAGKSTIISMLLAHLSNENFDAKHFTFPGKIAGTLGELVYRIHHHHREEFGVSSITPLSLQALHIAAHLDAIENAIIPALEAGTTIIMDRFWWSTWVYGRLNNSNLNSLDNLIAAEVEMWASHQPDHAIMIDRNSALREDGVKDWAPLRTLYHELISQQEGKYPIHVISNENSPEETLKHVCAAAGFPTPK